ncbi:MAG TPA: GH25 family lysozyme [Candidatus Limnocylindrales bacterium]
MSDLSAASSARRAPDRPARRPLGSLPVVAALILTLLPAVATGATAMPRTPSAAAATSSDAVALLEGIDVSHWQGAITWTKVAGAGKKFAIIKATDGIAGTDGSLYIDPMYATNHTQAKAAGLWTGAYHFARPSAEAGDAVREADHFAAHTNLGVGDLIPALDLEASGGLSVAALQTWVKTFLDEVTLKVGMRPMIYTSPAFWKKYMGDSRALADAGYKTLWIAHWGVTAPTIPAENWGGHGWTFWQYTSDGSVPGISGRVDLDRFNGLDLTPQAYSAFKLAATIPSGPVKQGTASTANVTIKRTNFTGEVALDVSGLPDGATATFGVSPTTGTATTLDVTLAADPSATPVGTYPLTISGLGGDVTRTTTLNLVVADGIPPTLVGPTTSLFSGVTLGTSTVPVRIGWSATDPSGVSTSAVQRSINGASWTTSFGATTSSTAQGSIPNGGTGQYRVRSTDKFANTSDWATGPKVRASVFQQTSSAVTWSGTWHTSSWSGASGGSVRYTTSKGASATFTFTGSSVAWVAAKGPTRGSVSLYVDGVYVKSVSLYASSGESRAIVFARSWGTVGTHTLKIVVAGSAGHPRVDVDAFLRLAIL